MSLIDEVKLTNTKYTHLMIETLHQENETIFLGESLLRSNWINIMSGPN